MSPSKEQGFSPEACKGNPQNCGSGKLGLTTEYLSKAAGLQTFQSAARRAEALRGIAAGKRSETDKLLDDSSVGATRRN